MNSKNLLIISSLVFLPACARFNIKPVQGYICLYDRREDTAYCQNLQDRKDEKEIKGSNLDGYYVFDSKTFEDLQRFKKEAERAIEACNKR